ncbi:MAG: hemolysin D [Pseudomonadota bacterium]
MIWARRLMILPPAFAGAAMIWQALAVQPEPPIVKTEERRISVSYVQATPRTFTPRITGYGTVEPARVWTAAAQVAGPIEYLNPAFVRGGFVAEGDVLVRIAAEDTQLALASADADLKSAEARLEELQVSRRTTSGALEIERASLDLADAELTRTKRLAEKGVATESIVQAQKRDVLAQRSKVQSLESTLALLPAQIKSQEQAVAKAQVAQRAAALDLERTIVRAPFYARVASVDVEVSQYVGIGTPIGVLDGSAAAEVEVQISQRRMIALAGLQDAFSRIAANTQTSHAAEPQSADPVSPPALRRAALASGDPRRLAARVSLSSGQGAFSWDADVDRVSDGVSSETRSVGVIVRVAEPYAQASRERRPPLMKGAFVKVSLAAAPVAGAILVPRSAVQNGRVMIAGPDDRLTFANVTRIFTLDTVAVLLPGDLPMDARIITSEPSPAIEGLLLSPQPDTMAEARLNAAAKGTAR